MRTTLELDDKVLVAARAMARDRGVSLGAAVSELALTGLRSHRQSPAGPQADLAFPAFEVDVDVSPITLDLVNAHRDE